MPRFRIQDLLSGRTLITSDRGRDLVAYHAEHFRAGYCDWYWQYRTRHGWSEIPGTVRRGWAERSVAAPSE